MSSTGQIVGAIVGAVIGFFTMGIGTGILYGAMYGMSIGGAIDPPKGPTMKSYGPRLSDLSSQTGSYGVTIPRIYGSVALLGNVFWIENNKLKEVVVVNETDSGGKGGSGGGTEETTYNYYATFALGLCEGPISGVRRIWIGSNLFYDAGSDQLDVLLESNKRAKTFTIYYGTEDQVPNSRIQAQHGNNTPAYRGLAYIVFYDLPLKDYGNSLMGVQVKVEVMSNNSSAGVGLESIVTIPPINPWYGVPYISDIDNNYVTVAQVNSDGFIDYTSITFYSISIPNLSVTQETKACRKYNQYNQQPVRNLFDRKNTKVTLGEYFNIPSPSVLQDSMGNVTVHKDIQCAISHYRLSNMQMYANTIWIITNKAEIPIDTQTYGMLEAVTTDNSYIYGVTTSRILKYDEAGNLIASQMHGRGIQYTSFTSRMRTDDQGRLFVRYDNKVYQGSVNLDTPWIDFCTLPITFYGYYNLDFYVYNDVVITAVHHSTGGYPYDNRIHVCIYNRKTLNSTTIPISTIVEAEALKAKPLLPTDLDVQELNSQISGYRISNTGSLKSFIEPVQGVYPFDVYQKGYKLKFRPRGGSTILSVPFEKLGATDREENPVLIKEERVEDNRLPSKVSISYLDIDREYDRSEQYAERISRPSVNAMNIEVPLVLNATEASMMADKLLYMYWVERSEFEFTLPIEYNFLEPTDVITLNTLDSVYEIRLTNIVYSSENTLECTGTLNNISVYSSNMVGEIGESSGVGMSIPGRMLSVIMDLPCVNSSMDKPSIAIAGTSTSGNKWSGGAVYRSDDNEQTWKVVAGVPVSSTIAIATNIISSWDSTRIDYKSVLRASMISGTLSSVTLEQLSNGFNTFAYGAPGRWEIVQVMNCVLQPDGTYLLSNLLRGRAGTEHNTGNHQIGDYIVYLNSSTYLAGVETSLIGSTRLYKSVSYGDNLSEYPSEEFTYNAANLECLSPVYLNGNRHPTTNDWTLNWIRRTRVGGEWRNYVDATLSESTESYTIEIFTSDYTLLKNTKYSSTPTLTYTSAEQITDFGSVQSTLYLKIYQNSSIVGTGIPLIASITR